METFVVGATGYVGQELVRIVSSHRGFELAGAFASETRATLDLPGAGGISITGIEALEERVASASPGAIVFLALPHGRSQELAGALLGLGARVVDLGADFRFADPAVYERWYGRAHLAPELLAEAVYGMVELNRSQLAGARLVAVPGCYVTAATLAAKPLVDLGWVGEGPVFVDGISGVSGAGKNPVEGTHFVSVNESVGAYGLLNHRHTGEMVQNLGREVLFTPHLAPLSRGLLATCYLPARPGVPAPELLDQLRSYYWDSPMVEVVAGPPSTREVYGSNRIRIHATLDSRTGTLLALGAIDNLTKGAAGQAVQAANLMAGYGETEGLATLGVWP